MRVLKVLDQALAPRTYLVGESLTLADMAVATAILLAFKYVRMRRYPMLNASPCLVFFCFSIMFYFQALEPSDRKAVTNVTRWFTTCINQPQFLKVLGEITLCEKVGPVTATPNAAKAANVAVDSNNSAANGKPSPPQAFKNIKGIFWDLQQCLSLICLINFHLQVHQRRRLSWKRKQRREKNWKSFNRRRKWRQRKRHNLQQRYRKFIIFERVFL